MFNETRLLKFRNILTVIMLLSMALISCSKKDDLSNTNILEFETTAYSIPQSGEVVIKIVTTKAVSSTTTIPFIISGNAIKGTDYELSADLFVIPAGGKIGEVKVKATASFDINKSFKLNLGNIPAGINAGNLLYTEVSITPRDIILYSFEYQKVDLSEELEVNLILQSAEGIFTTDKELRIPVIVDKSSTAVEGKNFAFDGPREFVVPAGKTKGVLKLKSILSDAGKNQIILKLGDVNNHYVAGNYSSTKVSIVGSSWDKLPGTWKFKAFTNAIWLDENTSGMGDDPTMLPKVNAGDLIMIDSNAVLSVQMTGDLKNYFRTATLISLGEFTERLQEAGGIRPPAVRVLLLNVSAMNVYFSSVKQKIRSGELGLRVFTEGGKDIMEVTIRDYEPLDFLANTYNLYKEFDNPAMKSIPLRFHFERVN